MSWGTSIPTSWFSLSCSIGLHLPGVAGRLSKSSAPLCRSQGTPSNPKATRPSVALSRMTNSSLCSASAGLIRHGLHKISFYAAVSEGSLGFFHFLKPLENTPISSSDRFLLIPTRETTLGKINIFPVVKSIPFNTNKRKQQHIHFSNWKDCLGASRAGTL